MKKMRRERQVRLHRISITCASMRHHARGIALRDDRAGLPGRARKTHTLTSSLPPCSTNSSVHGSEASITSNPTPSHFQLIKVSASTCLPSSQTQASSAPARIRLRRMYSKHSEVLARMSIQATCRRLKSDWIETMTGWVMFGHTLQADSSCRQYE